MTRACATCSPPVQGSERVSEFHVGVRFRDNARGRWVVQLDAPAPVTMPPTGRGLGAGAPTPGDVMMDEPDYDWTDADGDVRTVECSRCGEVRPCRWLVDPFIAEVYPERPLEPAEWCHPCYSDRHSEV